MSTITPNLGLKKPMGNEIVNRQAYNENLDLLDQNVAKKTDIALLEGELNHLAGTGRTTETVKGNTDALNTHLAEYSQEVVDTLPRQSIPLSHGLNAVNAPRASLLKTKFTGRTLVNLLGKDGNCEDAGKWNVYNATLTLDTINKVYGANSIKMVILPSDTNGNIFKRNLPSKIGSYYLVSADFKNGASSSMSISLYDKSGLVRVKNSNLIASLNKFDTAYLKFSPSEDGFSLAFNASGNAGQYGYVDGIRLYEITQAEYNALDTMTDAQIAAKYPYVDSVQVVQNPALKADGVNLLPPFSQWTLHANAKVVEPYKLELNATGENQYSLIDVKCMGGTKYTAYFNSGSNGVRVYEYKNGVYNGVTKILQINTPTFWVTREDTTHIRYEVSNGTAITGTFTFSNPMLVLGDTIPDHFIPYDPSYLYLQTPLYEGETLEEIDGQWVRTKKWEKKVLEGNLPWEFLIDRSGYKTIQIPKFSSMASDGGNGTGHIVKYDGKLLTYGSESEGTDYFNWGSTDYTKITVADTNSGWGENYTPTADEIKAYFYGWKMYDNVNPANDYSSGTKAWVKLTCRNSDGSWSTTTLVDTTNTCPTVLAGTDTNNRSYTPYQLHYQLATPVTEVVPHEGELRVHEGLNQVEVFEGVVVREIVTPIYEPSGQNYQLNNTTTTPNGHLNTKVYKFLDIYKNKTREKWSITDHVNAYGKQIAIKNSSGYDPTAQYSATYIALPEEFTAPCPDIQAELTVNLKTTVDSLVDELANVVTDVTALEMALRNRGLLKANPACRIDSGSSQAIPNDTITKVNINTVKFNTDNMEDVSNNRFLIRTKGKYAIYMGATFESNATGIRSLYFRVNGNVTGVFMRTNALNGYQTNLGGSGVRSFDVGDTVESCVHQTSGGTLTLINSTISIVKVGD